MSIFDKLFGRKTVTRSSERQNILRYDIDQYKINSWNKKSVDLYLIRASIDALARNIAKMELDAVMYTDRDNSIKKVDRVSDVARVLKRPNQYMSTYDFLYKVASLYYASNNAFIWPEYRNGSLYALWPINYENFQLFESERGTLIAKFRMNYRHTYTIPYDDLIHLRNHFIDDDLAGEPNSALLPVCELMNTQNEGIVNGIKNSAIIRGILKSVNVIKENDLKKARDRFVEDNLSASNNGGVIVVDGKFEYSPLESKPYVIDADTMNEAKKMVFDYFGVNEGFITNTFNPEQYEAVYEGRLEPFAIMLTQALTHGLYTARERGFGNEIEANMSKVKYQPISAITSLISATNQLGLFRKNEYREMLGYPPLSDEEGGNDIVISLNYVNSQNLDEYQEVGGSNDGEN
jgi:HK97 family phage portal protein